MISFEQQDSYTTGLMSGLIKQDRSRPFSLFSLLPQSPLSYSHPFGMALMWDHSKYFSINVQPKLSYVVGQIYIAATVHEPQYTRDSFSPSCSCCASCLLCFFTSFRVLCAPESWLCVFRK